jgi:arylsulfatase A-like enzyme
MYMKSAQFILLHFGISVCLLLFVSCTNTEKTKRPNILIILADDLGYGDLRCYNAQSLIPTPNLDRLASEGILLTDAYCPASVCSPSRFALMTGAYPFRSWKRRGVLANYEPSMIAQEQLTLPGMLQNAGYVTAGFGKWHLGATFQTLDGKKPAGYGAFRADDNGANLDLTAPISDGPVDRGFDQWLGFSCASECWILNDNRITAALGHELYTIEATPGHESVAIVELEDYLTYITGHAIRFMQGHATDGGDRPFFMYYAPYVPHVPLAVSESFRGTTGAGPYGDYVHELDYHIGMLLDTLQQLGFADNTVVLFASDNGSQFEITGSDLEANRTTNSPADMHSDHGEEGVHRPNAPLRGTKWSIYEGGVRTPLIARWPGFFPPGARARQIFALNDVMPTLAAAIGYTLPAAAAPDGLNQLPLLLGQGTVVRNTVVVQSSGAAVALRWGPWKYIPELPGPDSAGLASALYNVEDDVGETVNCVGRYPEVERRMAGMLKDLLKSP